MTKQRIVVVTGGGSGIGAEISYKFAKNGDLVYILGRNLNKLKVVAKKHQNIVPERVDITDPSSVEAARRRIAEAHPNVDVLVNCAGGNTKIDPDVSLEEANSVWSSIINANLTGTFNMIFAFLPHIERPGGRIINVTSLAAFVGSSQGAANGQAYAAAKSGVHGLSRTLANSISQEGITVNCVAPGVIDHTEFFGSEGLSAVTATTFSPRTS